jgi:hypothetical protein
VSSGPEAEARSDTGARTRFPTKYVGVRGELPEDAVKSAASSKTPSADGDAYGCSGGDVGAAAATERDQLAVDHLLDEGSTAAAARPGSALLAHVVDVLRAVLDGVSDVSAVHALAVANQHDEPNRDANGLKVNFIFVRRITVDPSCASPGGGHSGA